MRHFYSDPLAAAYMAKHFGMKYVSVHEQNWSHPKQYLASRNPSEEWANGQWEIHQESLHLLSPKYGDLVTNTYDEYNSKHRPCSGIFVGSLNNGKDAYVSTGERHNGKNEFCEQVSSLRIVQRKGVSFFWPESEAT